MYINYISLYIIYKPIYINIILILYFSHSYVALLYNYKTLSYMCSRLATIFYILMMKQYL